jgi:hypothetical protein
MATGTTTQKAGAKQRRGKKESTTTGDSTTNPTIEAQIAQAQAAVEKSEAQTSALHQQWRTYLLRLSFLLILLAMHQMQGPTAACVKDIKTYNAMLAAEEKLSGGQTTLLVLTDALPYLLGIVMAGSLAFFLILEEPGDFSNPRYLLANACMPPLLGLHFMRKDTASCLADELLAGFVPEMRERTLPVVVIFHVVVTACYWFMDSQRQHQARNMQMVADLQKDLTQAKGSGGKAIKKKK